MVWIKKRKGCAYIYVNDEHMEGAIVDRRGFGANPQITFEGKEYSSVEAAMKFSEERRQFITNLFEDKE